MHHGGTAVRRAPDPGMVEQVIAVTTVEAGHLMTEAFQMSRYDGAHVTAVPGDQNPHSS